MDLAFKTIDEFNEFFHSERACYEFYEQVRWENGVPVCPHCGSVKYYNVTPRGKFKDIPSYRCGIRECGLPFTVRTKTIFEGSKVLFKKWFHAIYEISIRKKSISSIELGKRIGVSQKTAWHINQRLREMLTDTNPELLKDFAAIDETLVGGKSRNKHRDKRIPNSQGRAANSGKTIVMGAIGLRGKVKTKVIGVVDKESIKKFANDSIKKGAIMVTDEFRAYSILESDYFRIKVNHTEENYVNGAFTTNGIENFWSHFKRTIIGTHHVLSPQHLQKYANECSFRYNRKDITPTQIFGHMIGNAERERTTYSVLTTEWKKIFPQAKSNNDKE
jgi:transposase-like protein